MDRQRQRGLLAAEKRRGLISPFKWGEPLPVDKGNTPNLRLRAESTLRGELRRLLRERRFDEAFDVWEAFDRANPPPVIERLLGPWSYTSWRQRCSAEAERYFALGEPEVAACLIARTFFGDAPVGRAERFLAKRAAYVRDLQEWRATDYIVAVRLLPGETACAAATSLFGCYRLTSPPMLPSESCESQFCTCTWEAIFDDEPLASATASLK